MVSNGYLWLAKKHNPVNTVDTLLINKLRSMNILLHVTFIEAEDYSAAEKW